VKGIRGKIVHDYQAIDALVIRGVVSRQLPRLITIVRQALASEEQSAKGNNATSPPPRRSPAGALPPRSTPPARRPPAWSSAAPTAPVDRVGPSGSFRDRHEARDGEIRVVGERARDSMARREREGWVSALWSRDR